MQRLRRLLAKCLAAIPMPILAGPNRGLWWSVPVIGRHWRGQWEPERVRLLSQLVRAGDKVWDIGAHHGLTVLMSSRLVGPRGWVHAFEPSAFNLDLLGRHVRWNRARNVTLHHVAVAGMSGERAFGGGHSSQTGRLGSGSGRVRCLSVADVLATGVPAPDFIKMDVEGSEAEILSAAAPLLPRNIRMLVSLHSSDAYAAVGAALRGAGFRLFSTPGVRRLAAGPPGNWPEDPDLLAVGPDAEEPMVDRADLQLRPVV